MNLPTSIKISAIQIFIACAMLQPVAASTILKTYNVDIKKTSVSGLSAGAFFASQFHVAHSADVMAMGSIAGSHYFCAEGDIHKAFNAKAGETYHGMYKGQCMGGDFPANIDVIQFSIDEAVRQQNAGAIDSLSNLQNDKLFLLGGALDPTVVPAAVDKVSMFYTHSVIGTPAINILSKRDLPDGHALPIIEPQSWTNDCGELNGNSQGSVSPWMSDCAYDAAGEMLMHFYDIQPGTRIPNSEVTNYGTFVEFDQSEFTSITGAKVLNDTGWAYIPNTCAEGEACKVHIAFHGCQQIHDDRAGEGSEPFMGDKFYRYGGYNNWAAANNIIVLYPQAKKVANVNPRGCFDWWGFEQANSYQGPCPSLYEGQRKTTYGSCTGAKYHTRYGVQIRSVRLMLERIAGYSNPPTGPGEVCPKVVATNYELVESGLAFRSGAAYLTQGTQEYLGSNGSQTSTVYVPDGVSQAYSSTDPGNCDGDGSGNTGKDDPLGSPGKWVTFNHNGDPVDIYLPTSYPVFNSKRALMINLHGCAQSHTDMRNSANWESVSEQYGMIVATPDVPGTGEVSGCWSYWDGNGDGDNEGDYYNYDQRHTRNNRHHGHVLSLVTRMLSNSLLNIDPNQVYISGLSSGAGEAAVLACLAPDVFAGIGINSSPALGTNVSQTGSVPNGVSATSVKALCESLAQDGNVSNAFSTQIVSIIQGCGGLNTYAYPAGGDCEAAGATDKNTMGPSVAVKYSEIMADAFSQIYASTKSEASVTVPGNPHPGNEWIYLDTIGARVSLVQVPKLTHAWAAGGGNGGSWIDTKTVNYPAHLTAFLFNNNRRAVKWGVQPPAAPVGVTISSISSKEFTVNWQAGSASSVQYNVYYSTNQNSGFVKHNTAPLQGMSYRLIELSVNTRYYVKVTGIDEAGEESEFSEPVTAITQPLAGDTTPPSMPSGLNALETGDTWVTLGWNANQENDLLGYQILQSEGSAGEYVKVGQGMAAADSTSYRVTGLVPNTPYAFAIQAVDSSNNRSEMTAPITVTTIATDASDTTPPAPPSGLQIDTVHDLELAISWLPSASIDTAGYNVYFAATEESAKVLVNAVVIDQTSHVIHFQESGEYIVYVAAVDYHGNESGLSDGVLVTVSLPPAAPAAFIETFSASPYDNESWMEIKPNAGNSYVLYDGNDQFNGSGVSLHLKQGGCFHNLVYTELKRTVTLDQNPTLSYSRVLLFNAAGNFSQKARFEVTVNGAVVDSFEKVFANYYNSQWQVQSNIDLSQWAGQTVEIAFKLGQKDTIACFNWSHAYVDNVSIN